METATLLIIDDDPITLETFNEIFRAKGYNTLVAQTGARALEILRQNEPDLALIDITLPDIKGTELLKKFKEDYPEMACVIVTGHTDIEYAITAITRNADGFFVKPPKFDALLGKVGEIIEKKRLKEEVRHLNELPRIILDSINQSVFIIGVENYQVVAANSFFLEEMGMSEEEVIGRTCHELTHASPEPCKGPKDECPLRKTVVAGEHVTVEHIHEIGDRKQYVEISTSPIFDDENRVTRVIHVSRDITDRKNLELAIDEERRKLKEALLELKNTQARIVQQEKMASIGQLAAGVAHEINNPMGFISSNLGTLRKYVDKFNQFIVLQNEALQKTGDDEILGDISRQRKKMKIDYLLEDVSDLIAESLDGADRVKDIVQNLKTFARIEENRPALADINDCLESTLKIVWNEIKYKATVNKDYGTLPFTSCYPQQLNQVFMNLLVNAAQAIEKQGEITISTFHEKETNEIRVAVSDTGCGIASEHLPHLFEPFFTTKPAGEGTGLGMSIAYDIVKKHGGEITVASAPGNTTFTVRLPVKDE